MARRNRLSAAGLYHHIFNRGNDKHPIFKETADYKTYLKLLPEYGIALRIDIISYALLYNHVHLFVFDKEGNISQFIEKLHGHYAKYYNKVHSRTSHVFGSRFKNKIVDANIYGIWLSRYIHRQAAEVGLVESPEDYEWTSYRSYIGIENNPFLRKELILSQFGSTYSEQCFSYREFVNSINNGPIDWEKTEKYFHFIIGDNAFEAIIMSKLRIKEHGNFQVELDEALDMVCSYFRIPREVVSGPRGKVERDLRRKVIVMLAHDYKFGVRQLSRFLGMSASSISAVINSENDRG